MSIDHDSTETDVVPVIEGHDDTKTLYFVAIAILLSLFLLAFGVYALYRAFTLPDA